MYLRKPYLLFIFIAATALLAAWFAEYVMGLAACPLCVYQRFPYLVIIYLAVIRVSDETQEKLDNYILLTLACAIVLSSYHTGVERGIFQLSQLCKPLILIRDDASISDFKEMLYNQEIALCDRRGLVTLGLSITEWNLLLNIVLFTIAVKTKISKRV